MYNKLSVEDIKMLQEIVGKENVLCGKDINPDYAHDELGGIEKILPL